MLTRLCSTKQMPQNSIRPDGIATLIQCIQKYVFTFASLSPIHHLINSFEYRCHKLEFLDLQDNTFTEIGSSAIAGAFHFWPALKHLNLGDCLLGSKGGLINSLIAILILIILMLR